MVEQYVCDVIGNETVGFPSTSKVSECESEPHSVETVKLTVYVPTSVKVITGFWLLRVVKFPSLSLPSVYPEFGEIAQT